MQRRRLFISALILAAVTGASSAARAEYFYPEQWQNEESRTSNMTPTGMTFYPAWLFNVPEHNEFLPGVSNHDAQNQHPQQWNGQDWEPALWNKSWTPERAVKSLYANGTFFRQYVRGKKVPVLEVGPTFYKLSDLDRRRSLKLLADQNNVFDKGFNMVELRDWSTKDVVGNYTPQGMHLN
jgi:hypothetical protein